MVDYSEPNPKLIRKMQLSSDDDLFGYLENAKRKLPDTQWFIDAIVDEQVKRGGLRNLNAESVRKVILEHAKRGQTCTYKTVGDGLGVSWEQAHWRLPSVLGEVSEMEHDHAARYAEVPRNRRVTTAHRTGTAARVLVSRRRPQR